MVKQVFKGGYLQFLAQQFATLWANALQVFNRTI
jgi:hypothetical protein